MTPDRDVLLLALIEANKALSSAHAAARRMGADDLAVRCRELAMQTFHAMATVCRGGTEQAVCS